MKTKIILPLLFILFATLLLADYRITRGPDIGEIYFIGPTTTGEGIYRSTDFGETAVCMDSTISSNVMSIVADKAPGVLYYVTYTEAMYRSDNYGQQGTWNFLKGGGNLNICSGVTEGHFYNCIIEHSEDYGNNFIQHSYNGFFGSLNVVEIDNSESIGYAKVSKCSVPDSIYLLISYDNFDSLEIQKVFNSSENPIGWLSRGTEYGELYTLTGSPATLKHSNDYGFSWDLKNIFYYLNNANFVSITGGRQQGELYILVTYTQLMGYIRHIYIYHSLDYGETFEVYHPFFYGPRPYYANFEANPTSGIAPLTVQFTDLSSGENIETWEWDFNNDGVIDSYQQNPEYTYQDTGLYTVKLTIHYGPIEDTATREDYIHVTSNVGIDDDEELIKPSGIKLNNYPNPFNPDTKIEFSVPKKGDVSLKIYNIKGQLVRTLVDEKLDAGKHSVIWWGKSDKGKDVGTGIYFYKIKAGDNTEIKRMLLLK